VSLVRCGLLDSLPIHATGVVLVDAQGQRIATEGEVELDLSVGHKKVRHTFVVASVTSDILLGMDFLEKFGCVVDFSGRILTVLGEHIPVQMNSGGPSKVCAVEPDRINPQVVGNPRLEPLRDVGQRVNLVRVQGLDLAKAQADDLVLGEIRRWKSSGKGKPPWSEISAKRADLKAYWAEWDVLEVKDGLLCRLWKSDDGKNEMVLPVVPVSLQGTVLEQVHSSPSGGHFGRKKTLSVLKSKYYWINRNRSVQEWCRNCRICASRKGPRKKQHGPAQLYLVGAPMERIAIDIVGPLPVSEQGNKYMLVAMDYFTKWPEVFAIPDQEAVTVARVLVENMFCRFGAPMELHSDQGRNFESAVFAEVCRLFGVTKTRTTPGYPQSDGMVERFNRTLLNALASFADQHQRDWDVYIPFILFAYRSAVHESTGTSPFLMMLGREVRGPVELLVPRPAQEEPQEVTEYGVRLRGILEEVHEKARGCLDVAGNTMKRRYDRGADSDGFQVGDAVWLYNPRCKKNTSPKLIRPWEGPYRVMDRITDVVYRIQLTPRSKPRVVNRFRLWRVSGELPDDWWRKSGGSSDDDDKSEEALGVPEDDFMTVNDDKDDNSDNFEDGVDELVTTRYGRTVRNPQRYGLT